MATGIFCTVADVEKYAGANASATSKAEAYVDVYTTCAESEINATVRYNFSDVYAALNDDVKGILRLAACCHVAINVILYDLSGFTSRIEGEDMINVHRDTYLRCIKVLKDKKQEDFIVNA